MKNITLVIIILLVTQFTAYSQIGPPRVLVQENPEGIHIGIHTMLGHSSITPQNAYGFTELDPEFFSLFQWVCRQG